jgi:hypothetical protein
MDTSQPAHHLQLRAARDRGAVRAARTARAAMSAERKSMTLHRLRAMHAAGEKITMLTVSAAE